MRAWFIFAIAGCQFSADPIGAADAPPTGAFRLSGHAGTVGVSGNTPLPGVRVDALGGADGAPIASAVTASDGAYEIAVPGGSVTVLHAQSSGYLDTYLYPAAALSADTSALDPVMFGSQTFSILAELVAVTQDPAMGWIGVRVVDTNGQPLGGATIEANGVVRYNGVSGLPISDGSQTQPDGTAYVFNTPLGQVQISVLHVGMPFAVRSIPVRGNSVTLALIGPGQQP